MRLAFVGSLAALLALPVSLSAQTVTVNKGGSGTYNNIAAALAHFTTDPDSGAANLVQITDTSVYEEVFNIEVPVTIECTASSATLAVLANTNGTLSNGGIFINLPSTITSGSVTLRNLNIIPAKSTKSPAAQNPPTELQTAIENGNNNLFLTLDQVVIAPNDGNDQPLVTDGVTNKVLQLIPTQASYNPNIVQWGDDGVVLGRTAGRFEGAGVELLVKDTVITHLRFDVDASTFNPFTFCVWMVNEYGTDPLNFAPLFRLTRVEGECGISFAWDGLNCAGDVEVKATGGQRPVMRGHAARALSFTGPAPNFRNISDLIMEGISQDAIVDAGFGDVRFTMDNIIMWSSPRRVLWMQKPSTDVATGTIILRNSTLVGARTAANYHVFRMEPGTVTDIVSENTIIAGKVDAPTNGFNVISLAGENNFSMAGTAIVTTGTYALRTTNPFSLGTSATVTGTATTNVDPQFAGIQAGYLPSNSDFADVQSPEYANANSTGGPLGGGADYIGPTSSVADWALYSETAEYRNEFNNVVEMHDKRVKQLKP